MGRWERRPQHTHSIYNHHPATAVARVVLLLTLVVVVVVVVVVVEMMTTAVCSRGVPNQNQINRNQNQTDHQNQIEQAYIYSASVGDLGTKRREDGEGKKSYADVHPFSTHQIDHDLHIMIYR